MAVNMKDQHKGPVIHGIPWFPGTTQEMVDIFPQLEARQNDTYIATYSKSGKQNNNSGASRYMTWTPRCKRKFLRPEGR